MDWVSLISALVLAGVFGGSALAHWLWTGRKAPLIFSYYRVWAYAIMSFGALFAFVAAIIFACMLLDWLGHAGWGYPLWAGPIAIAFIGLGVLVFRAARSFIRRGLGHP
jgi:hypothetical protein